LGAVRSSAAPWTGSARALRRGLAAVLLALLNGQARAQGEGVRTEDLVSVLALDQRVLAVNPVTGPVAEIDLELGERVLGVRSRGQIGVAATNRRLLGISRRTATWAELRYRVSESPSPDDLLVGDRIALVRLQTRLVGLTSGAPTWQALGISPGEQLVRFQAGANLAAVVTDRRAIAFGRTGFVEEFLTPREEIRRAVIDDQSISLHTSYRVLVFQSGARGWTWVRD
jgi:hypothetical protein